MGSYVLAHQYCHWSWLRLALIVGLGLYTLFNGFTIIPIEIVFADRAVRINGNNKTLAAVLYSTMYVPSPLLSPFTGQADGQPGYYYLYDWFTRFIQRSHDV